MGRPLATRDRRTVHPRIEPSERPALINRALELRGEGLSYHHIARLLGYSDDTARALCREGGEAPVRKAPAAKPRPKYDAAKNHLPCPACTLFVDVIDNVIEDHNLLDPLRIVMAGEMRRVPRPCPASGCQYDRLHAAIEDRKRQLKAA